MCVRVCVCVLQLLTEVRKLDAVYTWVMCGGVCVCVSVSVSVSVCVCVWCVVRVC